MTVYDMKKKISALLCAAMLFGSLPMGALAAGEATPSEAEPQTPGVETITPGGDTQKETVDMTISAKATADNDTLTIAITGAADEDMYISVYSGNGFSKDIYPVKKGHQETLEGLAAGEYEVEVDYLEAVPHPWRKTIAVEGAESITPPGGGSGAESITPPGGGSGAESITPPGGGSGAESITPPAGGETGGTSAPKAKQFEIRPIVSDGRVSLEITGASDWEIEAALYTLEGEQSGQKASRIGSGLIELGSHPAGKYTVVAQYVTPTDDAAARAASVTIEKGAELPPQPEEPTVWQIEAKTELGSDYVIVTVTKADDFPLYVALGSYEPRIVKKGDSVRFEGLKTGTTYDLEVDYVNPIQGVSPYRTSVEIKAPQQKAKIEITSVSGGENKISVTGRAEPNSNVSLTTSPATVITTVKSDAAGIFTAVLVAEPGEYHKIAACYTGHGETAVSRTGKFVVTAPASKPELTVDDVDADSTSVVAKTAPGVLVELKTDDYSQKVYADERGVLRFTLPHTYGKGAKLTFTVYYGENNVKSYEMVVTVGSAPYYGLLKKGSYGSDVKKLTQRLKDLGYPVSATKSYDSTVEAAVRLFQRANGLDDDGMAGKLTQKALFSVGAIRYGEGDGYPTLVRGDRGYALIYTLQQRLKDLGYYTIKVDGIFGSGTQRAVRSFQRVNGLSVTGKADNATQTLLYSSAAKPASSSVPDEYKTLERSSKYKSAVVPLQRRLKELGYYAGSVDGYFGSQTYRAVRKFQTRNGISATGKADPYTQTVLYSKDAKAASGSSSSSSSSSSSGYRLLYWGCEGSAVTKLQNALIDAGYKSIVRTADGIYGRWTYDAVRAYQKDHGLAVDGIAGKNTQNKLYGTSY